MKLVNKLQSPQVLVRLRSTFAGACYGFLLSAVANRIGLDWAFFVGSIGVAIQVYDLWPFQRGRVKFLASAGIPLVGAILIFFVVPLIAEGWGATLYYTDPVHGDQKLNGARITLGPPEPPGKQCAAPYVWATRPSISPDAFVLCGFWMKKPSNASSMTGFGATYALYVDLSQDDAFQGQQCRRSTERPKPPYVVSFICSGAPFDELNRWRLPFFYGAPVPAKEIAVRVHFAYPNNGKAEGTFILLPPKPR